MALTRVHNRMIEGSSVNVLDFGADDTGVTDASTAIQAALNSLTSGGEVIIPTGTYLISSPITLASGVIVRGDGRNNTKLTVNTDIEVFNSDTATVSSAISYASIQDLFIHKTVTTATTKYDIHLQNPQICSVSNVRVQSGHDDSQYSATNVGGIFFDRPSGSTSPAYINVIDNCWVQNNSVYLRSITDTVIRGGFIWGHVREFAIRIEGGGAIGIENIIGLITSKFKGGIWIDGSGVNQLRISGVEFDGNPLLDRGTGIYCPQLAIACTVTNNTFWGCDLSGIEITDPVGWSITGNVFWKNNDSDQSADDIRIVGKTFQPNGNVVSGNTFTMDVARTNKGYAIREYNSGFSPTGNTYTGNGIIGSTGYQNPAFLLLGDNAVVGNTGVGTANQTALPSENEIGADGILLAKTGLVASAGTLDLTVNTDTYVSNPGGFSGILSVSSTRSDFPTQSRKDIFAVVGQGTTATFNSLASINGSGGGTPFTIGMTTNGVIRFTDTAASGSSVWATMSFSGTKSFA